VIADIVDDDVVALGAVREVRLLVIDRVISADGT